MTSGRRSKSQRKRPSAGLQAAKAQRKRSSVAPQAAKTSPTSPSAGSQAGKTTSTSPSASGQAAKTTTPTPPRAGTPAAKAKPVRPSVARAALRRRQRRQRFGWLTAGVAVLAAIGVALGLLLGGSGLKLAPLSSVGRLQPAPAAGPTGPEGVPIPAGPALASTATAATGQVINGISCASSEQTLFHVHTHLTIFVNGKARQIPYGIGITPPRQVQQSAHGAFVNGGSCFYWLHTHAADGIIHIESPVQRTFTLGDFFSIWGQPLGPNQVGPARGRVTAFYNHQVYLGNPRQIPLGRHVQIQLNVGRPLVAPEHITFPSGI